MSERRALRSHFRSLRNGVTGAERTDFELQITTALGAFAPLLRARSIAAYLASDGEVDLALWIEAVRADRTVALPCVGDGGDMSFRSYEENTALEPNRYGILEPRDGAIVTDIDCVLVPLVAFDADGNRLGMGGGYYDRYFGPRGSNPTALLIGIAFSCQKSTAPLPHEDWDVRLNAIVTETGIVEFS